MKKKKIKESEVLTGDAWIENGKDMRVGKFPEKWKIKFGRARRGRGKVHVIMPYGINLLSLCRYAENMEITTKEEFLKNPCSKCKRLIEDNENWVKEVKT